MCCAVSGDESIAKPSPRGLKGWIKTGNTFWETIKDEPARKGMPKGNWEHGENSTKDFLSDSFLVCMY